MSNNDFDDTETDTTSSGDDLSALFGDAEEPPKPAEDTATAEVVAEVPDDEPDLDAIVELVEAAEEDEEVEAPRPKRESPYD